MQGYSNWMKFHFRSSCFLLLLLAWSCVTRGVENNSKQKCSYQQNLITLVKNTSEYLHDYFGRPMNEDKMFKGTIQIFHLKMINETKFTNVPSTEEACCQWNSEGCHVYVWFRRFYFLLISPIDLKAFSFLLSKSYVKYLPQSFCISIPSEYHKKMITLTDNVSRKT